MNNGSTSDTKMSLQTLHMDEASSSEEEDITADRQSGDKRKSHDNESFIDTDTFPPPQILSTPPDDIVSSIDPCNVIIKVAVESRIVTPDGLRMTLRNIVMSLLISNSVLWIFLSLDGTAFHLNQYQSEYFGDMGWNVITLICKPLFILYRMHSAGCLFEIWSFA